MNPFSQFAYSPTKRTTTPPSPVILLPTPTTPTTTTTLTTTTTTQARRTRKNTARHHLYLSQLQENKCALCKDNLMAISTCNLYDCDHKIPFGLGGEDVIENLQLLCQFCHRAKTMYDNQQIRLARRIGKSYSSYISSKSCVRYLSEKTALRKRVVEEGIRQHDQYNNEMKCS